jgi:hypothetical protein
LFRDASWFSVLVGQNHLPHDYNPLLDAESTTVNAQVLSEQRRSLASAVTAMPMHFEILKRIVNTTSVQGVDCAGDQAKRGQPRVIDPSPS